MHARITTSSVHLAWTLSRDRNGTELVVIRARMSDLLWSPLGQTNSGYNKEVAC